MSLARTLRLTVCPGVKLESLALQPQDFFVFSRVERPTTVAEIIVASGLAAAAAEESLERLLELGALTQSEDAPTSSPAPPKAKTPRPRQSTQELRAQAQDRRKRLLAQQLGRSKTPTGTTIPAAAPDVEPPKPPPPAEPTVSMPPVLVPMVAEDDPRLDASLGLPIDEQRRLLGLHDSADDLTPFEVLGIHPTGDVKAIRGAFRDASRRFHPDAHRGRALGGFAAVLSALFAEAKQAYDNLQREEVRAMFIAVFEADRQGELRLIAQRRAAAEAAEALRLKREQQQHDERRSALAAQRVERERERAQTAAKRKIEQYVAAAQQAEEEGNLASAANNYRLALQLSPNDAELQARWSSTLARARKFRAADAFARATRYNDLGHRSEAVPLYLEAAEADPTVEHLAHAADAVGPGDPNRARDLAMSALRTLSEAEQGDTPPRPNHAADLRLLIARAFIAAGQTASARQQLQLVSRVRPKDPAVPGLLKSLKVT